MATCLEKYLARVPADMKVWMDLAAVRVALQTPDEAIKALQQAIRIGGDDVLNVLKADPRFDLIRGTTAFQKFFVK